MKKINLIPILLLLLSAYSCEEFLTEEPQTFVSTTNFYNDESDARTATDAIYQSLSSNIYARWWPIIDVGTDDASSKLNGNTFSNWHDHTIAGSEAWFESWAQYSGFWEGIGRANSVIANLPGIDMDDVAKNEMIGEARAMRALNYFHLVRTYGDVPMIVDEVKVKDDFLLPRSSVNDIYEQVIIPDLQFAAENCKDALHDGRVTKWTAKVILADVYQTYAGWRRTSQGEFVQGDSKYWELARDMAKDVIDNSPNSLITEPAVNGQNIIPASGVAWSVYHPFTSESMMELGYTGSEGLGSWLSRECAGSTTGTSFWGANTNAKPFSADGITLTINQMKFPKIIGVGLYIPSPDLWREYEAGDERREASILTRYINAAGTTYLTQPGFRKYVDFDYYEGLDGTSFQYTNNNFLLYRYADALLIYAEAANEVAPAVAGDDAYQAVNDIRNRAGLEDLTTGLSQDEFREAVWHERRCEFAGECKRRFDLIRTNRLKTETDQIDIQWLPTDNPPYSTTYTNCQASYGKVLWPDREWLMPIPYSEMELNRPYGWVQNDGYAD
ncbi:RagB/SusD family nutrient uptake outer membrane protein [Mangrovibacterium sp.]|uniref:RagB/SusD family nutrient uptake outer membrane protein n=1 Tax=Mangrovibacterium sp. TaxID=1961364 RepID=UPI0035633125